MSSSCLVCLGSSDRGDYHPRCLVALFGKPVLPAVQVEVAKLHTLALAMVGKTTLSGIQRKISLSLSAEKSTLQLAVGPGRYILKPQSSAFPALPENEHVTMRLAALAGIEAPPSGLVRLPDGTLAYIVLRFDRLAAGGKLRQEDFCQLAEKPPKEKYDGSAELCARIVRRHATEPLVELVKLFRLLVFAWWSGNGDMHLKNFSLLAGADGIHRLSPAYDQLSTRLVIPDDDLALPVCGKKAGLSRHTWLELARYCRIPETVAGRVIGRLVEGTEEAGELISRSLLSPAMKVAYRSLLEERSRGLAR
ncbi:MAG: HipA domain-containing protein [Planctomycetes bacterium]|nr:HipA domain-containing protein [Planctomycetota bacterium]